MQKDLYAPYPSNLIHPTSTGSSQSHTRGGRAASVAGRRQARAEGERAGGHARGGRARARRASASAEGGRRAQGERGWPAPGERGGHLQPW